MNKINLLYIITKLELGGAQKQLLSLITHLDKRRYKPSIITAEAGLLIPDACLIDGLKLEKNKFLERPISPLKDLLALIRIYWFIKKNHIEIVHTHSSKAGILGRWAARLAGVKVIVHTVHGWSFNDHQPAACRWFSKLLERLSAGSTSRLITVSDHDTQKGLKNNIGSRKQYTLIPYGVDYSEFDIKAAGAREEFKLKTGDLVVGMVSCFKPQKSPCDFIKLAYLVNQRLPGTKFLLAGDGVLRKAIENSIAGYKLEKQVILIGWRRDIPRVLSAIDIFVLTSLWEGMPITVLEAMAASLPVVVTDTGGVSEMIVDSQSGFLVKPQDIENMAEKAVILLKDADLRKKIGENAKTRCLNAGFTPQLAAGRTQLLYESLL